MIRFYLLTIVLSFTFPFAQAKAPVSTNTGIRFLENKGQWPAAILYQATSGPGNVYLLKDGFSFSQTGDRDKMTHKVSALVWNMKFISANPSLQVKGELGKESVYNFLSGPDPAKWVIHPYEYTSVKYYEIYKNTDLHIYGSGSNLKYDYVLRPGSKLNSIKAYYEGVNRLSVNPAGDLEIYTDWNMQIQKAPVAWQIINGSKQEVEIIYTLVNDTTFGFKAVNGYDPGFDLVIDPLFQMVWSSYTQATGASNNLNYAFSNAMDRDGNVYLTGMVDGTFPITPGAYSGTSGISPEIFVAKFSKDGTTMLYSTYVPGTSDEMGLGIAVDSLGRAYITGHAMANITGGNLYPTTPSAYQPAMYPSGGYDAILTVLNETGSALVYSTYFGGNNNDEGYSIAIDDDGMVYIGGLTTSDASFPIKASSAFPSGTQDAFVAKFDITQSGANSLIYSVRIGGNSFCAARSLDVNNNGNAFFTGVITGSGLGNPTYPVSPGAYNTVYNGGNDNTMALVTKLSATTPVTIDYATYIGPGLGSAIAVDKVTDEVYIAGSTRTFTFPVSPGALQSVHGQDALGNPNSDAFVFKLDASGSNMIYSTFLGGQYEDLGTGISINSIDEAYVVGTASSLFPTSPGAYQANNAGSLDFFAVHINASGTTYGCGGSTLIGGSDSDYGTMMYNYPSPKVSIRDHSGVNDTISISGTSHSQDFPTTPGVYGPVKVNSIADQPVFFKLTCLGTVSPPPVANFTSSISVNCSTAVVNFNDISTNSPTTWQWTFQGAIPANSNSQNPQGITYNSSGLYAVSLVACNTGGCDTISDSLQITIPAAIIVNLGNDTTVCNGNSVQISAAAGFTNYSWQLNGTTFGGNTSSITANQSGIYTVVVTDSSGCTGTDTIMVTIQNPIVSLGPDILLCNNDSVQITATSGFTQYLWQYNGSNLPNNSNVIFASQQGIYTVTATDSAGCEDTDTLMLTVGNISLTLSNDTSFCSGDSVILNAGSGYNSYQWQLNGTTISSDSLIIVSQTGIYSLLVTTVDGCSATDSVDINVYALPVIQTLENLSLCTGQSVTLTTTGAVNYTWNPVTYLSAGNVANPVSTPLTDITYSVTGIDANGCIGSDEITITVMELPVAEFSYELEFTCNGVGLITENKSVNATSYLWNFGDGTTSTDAQPVHIYTQPQNLSIQLIAYNQACADTHVISGITINLPLFDSIPNVITPNGDGVNECFEIPNAEQYNDCFSLTIFNRWGSVVYETDRQYKCWGGVSKDGTDLPEGVYLYLISINQFKKQGTVHVLRNK